MKKTVNKKKIFAAGLAMLLLLSGCGSNSNSYKAEAPAAAAGSTQMATTAVDYGMAEEAYDMDNGMSDATYAEQPQADVPESTQSTNRKLIRNVNLDVETRTFDELMAHLQQKTNEVSGYIENSSTYNGSIYDGRESGRNAYMTIRIPATQLDAFLDDITAAANVTSRSENVTDVTLTYVDMESHKNALRAEEERLMELMDKAETIEDLITIENRLTDIRYQIESMESQLRTYDNLVDYATLTISIREVGELTPVVEQTAWEKMGSGFMKSLSNIGNGFKNFFIGLVMRLPYLVLWAAIIFVIFKIVKALIKKENKKRAERWAAMNTQSQPQNLPAANTAANTQAPAQKPEAEKKDDKEGGKEPEKKSGK